MRWSPKAAAAFAATVCVTVVLTVALSVSVDFLFRVFADHELIACAFPLAGLAAWLLYRLLKVPFTWGTAHVIGNVQTDEVVSARLIPGIFLGTCATILVGGSVGKEAAALQMGGGAAASISRAFGLDKECERMLCACALSSALSVLLGAPIAGALFAVEAMQYRSRKPLDYVSIVVAACLAKAASWALSLDRLRAFIVVPDAGLDIVGWVVLLALACALLSMGFCASLSFLKSLSSQGWRQIPMLVGVGIAAAVFILLGGGGVYSGTGMNQIGPALAGEVDGPYFLGKALFTLVLIGVGFKGGEIMPTLCIGVTLGSFFGHVVGVEPSFMAAVALVAYFSACTNCPLAALFLGIEAFGLAAAGWFALAAILAYIISMRFSFYSNATFYSSLIEDVVRKTSP